MAVKLIFLNVGFCLRIVCDSIWQFRAKVVVDKNFPPGFLCVEFLCA
jgi:hypothetical protein